MAKMIITTGIPGSGKSEWSKQQPIMRVCRDDIREELFGHPYKFSKAKENIVTDHRDKRISDTIKNGFDVIVDETSCNAKSRNSLIKLAEQLGCDLEWKIMEDSFDVDLCHKRNTARQRSVPYEVIERMFIGFIDFVKDRPEGDWLPRLGDGYLSTLVCDLDGTLASHEGIRSPFDWDKVGLDEPKHHVIDIVNNSHWDCEVIILSGRDGSCREETIKWLDKYDVNYDRLLMRAPGDCRKDYVVKMELVREHLEDDYDIKLWIDDRVQIQRYVNALGINLLGVGWNNFF